MALMSGIVLAAGECSRMGQAKALLDMSGCPLALAQARLLVETGCEKVYIVLGRNGEHIADKLEWPDLIVNEEWEKGAFSSIQAGLKRLNEDHWAYILPVDCVGLKLATMQKLARACMPGIEAVSPVFDKRRGRPAILAPELWKAFLGLDASTTRLAVAISDLLVAQIQVSDPAVHHTVDTPEEWATIQESLKVTIS